MESQDGLNENVPEDSPQDIEQKEPDLTEQIQRFRGSVINEEGLKSRTDDNFLLRFLRARKFDQKRALQLLKNYYKQRNKYPDLYKNLQASSLTSDLLTEPMLGFLPRKDSKGRAIFVFNTISFWDPTVVSVEESIRYCLLSLEKIVEDEEVQRKGIVLIFDYRGMSFGHMRALMGPFVLVKVVNVFLSSFPLRFKEIHLINSSVLLRVVLAAISPLLTSKFRSRMQLHGADLEKFHRVLPPEILPEEFGGLQGPFSNRDWARLLLENDPEIRRNMQYGYLQDG